MLFNTALAVLNNIDANKSTIRKVIMEHIKYARFRAGGFNPEDSDMELDQ